MEGRLGNDWYLVDNRSDVVIEGVGGGFDRISTSVSYALRPGSEVELLSTTNNEGTAAIDLSGNEYANTIVGNAGDNVIDGRGGNDQLSGGAGHDRYVFREYGAVNADTLFDFDGNQDELRFDSATFSAMGGPGHFAADDPRFYAAAGATGGHDADDRLVYDTSTGQLYYDPDGAGGAGAQLVATIHGAAPLVAPDIWVI